MKETLHPELKETLLSNFKSFESRLNGKAGSSTHHKRKESLLNFEKFGFPNTKNEEWKYTNIAPALEKNYKFPERSSLNKKDIQPFLFKVKNANTLVFLNGKFYKELSEIVSPADSFIITNFGDGDQQSIEKYFSTVLNPSQDGFTALNTAFAENGAFIRIPKDKIVEAPILLYFISDASQSDVFIQPRNLIIVEENSQVKIVESFHTVGGNISFTNTVTEVVLKQDAFLEYYKIENDADNSYHVGTTQIMHEAKSHSSHTTITLSGALVRNNLNLNLNAQFCEATLYGLYMLSSKQHADNHTLVNHAMPNCYSNELYKGILNDKSTGVFNGKIYVKTDAQKTNAFQSNKNILLSKDATMNTKPQLEIYADDVKCSHGATVGQMDEEPLFYLRSRGIPEKSAKALLVNAFASDILEHIKIESLKEHLKEIISHKLLPE
jgi:Fe-S cluster assembly protein SufD